MPLRSIRTYEVTVTGFPPVLYSARTPGKAMAMCYRDYGIMDDRICFKDFMRKARVRRAPDPPGIGERILVGGLPATRCIGHGPYIYFMRDDGHSVLCSHKADVIPMEKAL